MKARTFTYSIRKRLLFVNCILFVAFIATILFCNIYFTALLRKNAYHSIVNTLEIYNKQLSADLKALEIYLFEINENNIDISLLNNPDSSAVNLNIVRIKNLLSNSLPSFAQADGFFTYSSSNDIFITKYKGVENYYSADYLRMIFRSYNQEGRLNELDTTRWSAQKWSDRYHLLRIIRQGNSYIGAWADMQNLTAPFRELTGYDADVFFVDRLGTPLISDAEDDNIYNPTAMEGHYSIFEKTDGNRFISGAVRLAYCDYYMVALSSLKNIDSQMTSVYRLLFLLAGAIIALTPVVLYLLNKMWNEPLTRLQDTILTLHSGSYDARISLDSIRCKEFFQVYNTFNEMIDEIQKLRISIYEERIAKTEFELQYLKSQLAPHFLINCLYSISSLSGHKDTVPLVQDMVFHLTDHLRYTLSSRTRVSLKKELRFVENYIRLAQLRAPDSISYEFRIDQTITDTSVFPMILLMFTENTIKHNLIVGERLEILIEAMKETRAGHDYIHLVHIDSGEGFTEEILNKLSKARYDADAIDWEGHIGVYNTFKRLIIVYGEQGEIHCSNEPGKGARIDIHIPYESYDNVEKKL